MEHGDDDNRGARKGEDNSDSPSNAALAAEPTVGVTSPPRSNETADQADRESGHWHELSSHPYYIGPEADSNPSQSSDTDSGFGSPSSSTRSASLTSSVFAYYEENGRRYHASRGLVKYALPNDEQELDRLDLQHHLFYLTLGGNLYRAPLSETIHQVLDIGTGTGIWAVDMAEAHPDALVIGTDISPVQPVWVPANLHFYVDDMEAPWTYTQKFDFIHGRMLVVGIKDWPRLFNQAFDALKPGGWVEFQDLRLPIRCDDDTVTADSPLLKWSKFMIEGAAALGLDLGATDNFPTWLAEAGFDDIRVERYAWPLNRWPKAEADKERGVWAMVNFLEGLQGFSMGFYTRGLGWTKDEVEVFLADVSIVPRTGRTTHIYQSVCFQRENLRLGKTIELLPGFSPQ